VKDTKTGLEWVAEPGKVTNWNEAKAWVESVKVGGGGWRMPTVKELEGLYEKGKGRSNMTHLLMTVMTNSPWYVWSGETSDSSAAWGFDFLTGLAYWTSLDNQFVRAFAVRSQGGVNK
jgi:hypothetical protein